MKRMVKQCLFCVMFIASQGSYAGFPVADPINLIPNFLTSLESTLQTAQQVEEYRIQLQQFQFELQNTLRPVEEIWDDAQDTINGLIGMTDTLNFYKNRLGSLDAFLSKFQNVDYYLNSPCFSADGCSTEEWLLVLQTRELASESQKKANDALFRGLDQQQSNLESDARQLRRLQNAASNADGQLAAIGYANQIASHQSNQLMQIRNLLITQQNVATTRLQSQLDKEARQEAAHAVSTESRIEPTAAPSNWLNINP